MNNVWALLAAITLIYGVLAIAMGVIPGIALSGVPPTTGRLPYSAAAQAGRAVYVSEGCEYCHTQNVRPLAQDAVFGRASVAGDYAYDTPELLGDHRNGPDLANIGNRQPSAAWQYMHLYDPRSVVHGSIMPQYPWLFENKAKAGPGDVTVALPPAFAPHDGVIVATQRAQDLVQYLSELKQAPLGGGHHK